YGDESTQYELVSSEFAVLQVLQVSTAGGDGEQEGNEIANVLGNISKFLQSLHQGRKTDEFNQIPSFPQQISLARRLDEQIEEEGGNEEIESQLINKKIYDVTSWAKDAKGDCNVRQHGQCGNGVEHQEMESQKTDVIIGEKDPVAGDGQGHTAANTTHSGSGEQSSGSTEYDVNERRLLDQTGSNKRCTKPVRISCMVGRLCDKNEQAISKILKALAKVEIDKAQAILLYRIGKVRFGQVYLAR
ncbi:MAG: hypothetical protein EZS28_020686, partial [Streblomastix strix]